MNGTGTIAERVEPRSLDSEQAVLGGMLISKTATAQGIGALREGDFYLDAHRRIFRAIADMARKNEPVDVLTVPEELRRRGELEQIGDIAYINTLAESVPTAAHVGFYAESVAEKSDLRALIGACGRFAERAMSEQLTAEELRREFVAELVRSSRNTRHAAVRFGEVMTDELQRILERRNVPAMQFGIPGLDLFCGGLEDGELGIMAGAPGTGKTALLHQMIDDASQFWGPGLVFSLEVNRRALVRRQLARVSGYSYRELRTMTTWQPHVGYVQMDEGDVSKIIRAAAQLEAMAENVWIEDSVSNLDSVIASAHEKHAEVPLRWVAIDYAQLVEVKRAEKRNIEVEAVTRAAKNQIATPLGLPLWMISSLSKEGMRGSDPGMNALAESASLQYTAGLILMLAADDEYGERNGQSGVIGNVVKCRNDRAGKVPLLFHKPMFMLTDRQPTASQSEQHPPPFPTYGDDDPFNEATERGIR